MQPIRTIIEIRYKEQSRQLDFVNGIIKAVGGTPVPANKISLNQTFNIQPKDKNMTIIVEPQRLVLNTEEEFSNIEQQNNSILKITDKLNDYLQWGDVYRIGIRTFWIKEVSSFSTLLSKIKEVFFKENSLLEQCIDVAIPLTFNAGSTDKVNFNFGPMKKEQIFQQYLQFKDNKKIPENFAFVDIDYYRLPTSTKYSKKYFLNLLNQAMGEGQKKSEELFQLLNI
jgi:hypothetical protein